jgi:probable F420-dependent oxidoreductase
MKVGIRLPSAGPFAGPEAIAAVAKRAEEVGFDSVWATDHVILPNKIETKYPYRDDGKFLWDPKTPYIESIVAQTWAAAATKTITIGSSVLILPWRPAVLTAKQLASLDVMSGGRLKVGVGTGWMEEQFKLLEAPFHNRGKRLNELIRLFKHMWESDEIDFQGQFYKLSDFSFYPKPLQKKLPIICGGYTEDVMRRVAAVGDGWVPLRLTPEQYKERIPVLKEMLAQHNRTIDELELYARPIVKVPVTRDTLNQYEEIGVGHFIVDPPFENGDLSEALGQIDMYAESLKLGK